MSAIDRAIAKLDEASRLASELHRGAERTMLTQRIIGILTVAAIFVAIIVVCLRA